MPTADPQQLLALISSIRRSDDRRVVIAVRAEPTWTGPDVIEDGDVPVRVVSCPSPLSVRAALVDHERSELTEVLALLTQCSDGELGPDVLARLAKGRVLSLDPFTAVAALFRASVLDPALARDERWLIDDLIALAPPGGWPNERLVNKVLDVDTAWMVWHRERLGIGWIPETLAEVVRAADEPRLRAAVAELSPEQRSRVAHRWAGGTRPTDVIVDLIAAGNGADAIPLGLVVDVLWTATGDPNLVQLQTLGRARLETTLGRGRVEQRSAAAWAEAANVVIDHTGAGSIWVDRADRLLLDADVGALSALSDRLPTGFEHRLGSLAEALSPRDLAAAEHALASIGRHAAASRKRGRVTTAAAAVRLLRRASSPVPMPADNMPSYATAYASDGAWVDEARRLLADGDQHPALAAAYTKLCAEFDQERRAADLHFAAALALWSASEPVDHEDLLPVEQVLDRVLVPVARDAPVMLLVCDGMSISVAHELLRDIAAEGWVSATPSTQARWPVGIAMLPTVTEVSRASLLSGVRVEGEQPLERAGFTAHTGLRNASSTSRPPVLFHKRQLVGPSGQALSEEVRSAVSDPSQRVVGVVVNAVDDHLDRGQQVRVGWDLQSLRPLEWLLDAAAEAGRVIVLTADHGHVIHGEGAMVRRRSGDTGGERWRVAPPAPDADEVEVVGPRVLKGGRVVLPVDERIRYAGHKHGYHGGATPQEVLVPLVALVRSLPDGWVHRPVVEPSWWSGREDAPTPAATAEPIRSHPKKTPPQASLFEPEVHAPTVTAGADWVDAFLASPAFVAQRERTRLPRPLAPERVVGYLANIHANGGTIELAALATRVGEPVDQLRMALTMVQRLLNLDGAEILAVRGNSTVELNTELLRLQFEVDVP